MARRNNSVNSRDVNGSNNTDFYRQKNLIVDDAYDRLIAHIGLNKERDNIQTITVTGCEPCAGATTIGVNLAILMSAIGWKTLLINADMKKGLGTDPHAKKQVKGLSHYLRGEVPLESIITATNLDNLSYISSGRPEQKTVDLIYSQFMMNLIKNVKEKFDVIIFDVPSINVVVDASIIASKTDVTILVAKQKSTKITHIQYAKSELDNVGAKLAGIVLNKVDKSNYRSFMKHYNYLLHQKMARSR